MISPGMTAGRLDLPGDRQGLVYILYNRARSRFAITDDTQLSQRFALRVAEFLENQGLSVCSPNEESHQSASEIELVTREANAISWTVIVLTPEFLKGSWDIYKTVPALRRRFTEQSSRDNTICLALGINPTAIPKELSSFTTISFNPNFKDNVESWTSFQRHFVSPAFHANPGKPDTCRTQLVARQDKMSLHNGTSTRNILDYKARCIDLPTERSLGSWYHPSLPHLTSPPSSPPADGREIERNSSAQIPESKVNAPVQGTPVSAGYNVDGYPPYRFAHLYRPLPRPQSQSIKTEHLPKSNVNSRDSSPETALLGCDIDRHTLTISQASQTKTERLGGFQPGPGKQIVDVSRQFILTDEELRRNDASGNVPQRKTRNQFSRENEPLLSLNENNALFYSRRKENSTTIDVQRIDNYGHTTRSKLRESVYFRPRRTFSSSPRRTFAYTDHSIQRLEKRQRSPASKADVATDKDHNAQGSTNISETYCDGGVRGERESLVNSAVSHAIPRVHVSHHSSDNGVRPQFKDRLKENCKSFQSDFEEREKRFYSKQESALRCPCHFKHPNSVSPSVTSTDTLDQRRCYSQDVFVARGGFSANESIDHLHHTVKDEDVTDTNRNSSQHSSLSCHDTSSLGNSQEPFSFLSPIRPRHTIQRIQEFPRASSPLCMIDSHMNEDSLPLRDPSGSYLQGEYTRQLPQSPITSESPRRLLDSCELYSSPVFPDLNRSDLSADLTYVHSRLEEHSRSLLDHSTRLHEIIGKASKAIEVRRSFNSSLSDANAEKSKNVNESIPLDEEVYFSLPPLRKCNKSVSVRSEDSVRGYSASLDIENRTSGAFSKGVQKLKQLTEKSLAEGKTPESTDGFCDGAGNYINVNHVFRPLSMDSALSFLKEPKDNVSRKDIIQTTHYVKPETGFDGNDHINWLTQPYPSKSLKIPRTQTIQNPSNRKPPTLMSDDGNEPHTKRAVKTLQSSLPHEDVSGETCASVCSGIGIKQTVLYTSNDAQSDVSFDSVAPYDQDKCHDAVSAVPVLPQFTAVKSTECNSITDSGVFDKSLDSVISNNITVLGTLREYDHPAKYNPVSGSFDRVYAASIEDDTGKMYASTTGSSLNEPMTIQINSSLKPTNFSQIPRHNCDEDTQFLRQNTNTSVPLKGTSATIQVIPHPENAAHVLLSEVNDSESGSNSTAPVTSAFISNNVTFTPKNDNAELSTDSKPYAFETAAQSLDTYIQTSDSVDFFADTNTDVSDKIGLLENAQSKPCGSANHSLVIEMETPDTLDVSPDTGIQACDNVNMSPDAEVEVCDIVTVSPDTEIQACDNVIISPDNKVEVSDIVAVKPDIEVEVSDTAAVTPDVEVEVSDTVAATHDVETGVSDTVSVTPVFETEVSDIVAVTPDVEVEVSDTTAVTLDVEIEVSDTVAVTPDVEAEVSDIGALTPDVVVVVSDAVAVTPDVEADVSDTVAVMSDVAAEVSGIVALLPDDEVEVSDTVAVTPDTENEVSDAVVVSPDAEVEVCDISPVLLDTDIQACYTVTVSPDAEVEVCDIVSVSPDTDNQGSDTDTVEPEVCDISSVSLDTDIQTSYTITVSPDPEVKVCNIVSISPDTEVQACDTETVSSDANGEVCDTVSVSPDTGIQTSVAKIEVCDISPVSRDIAVPVSPDVEFEVRNIVSASSDTDIQTSDDIVLLPDAEVEVCDSAADLSNMETEVNDFVALSSAIEVDTDTLDTDGHALEALDTARHVISDVADKCQISDAVNCECNAVDYEDQAQNNVDNVCHELNVISSVFQVSGAENGDDQAIVQAVDECKDCFFEESKCNIPDDLKNTCHVSDAVHCECHGQEIFGPRKDAPDVMHSHSPGNCIGDTECYEPYPFTHPTDVSNNSYQRSSVGVGNYEQAECFAPDNLEVQSTVDCERQIPDSPGNKPLSSDSLSDGYNSVDFELDSRYSLNGAFFTPDSGNCERESPDSLYHADIVDQGGHSPDSLDCGHHSDDSEDCGRDSTGSHGPECYSDNDVDCARHSPDSLDCTHHSDELDCEDNTFDSLHYIHGSATSQDCARHVSDSLDCVHHTGDSDCEVNTFNSLHYVHEVGASQDCTRDVYSTGCEYFSHANTEDNGDCIRHTPNRLEFKSLSPEFIDCHPTSTDLVNYKHHSSNERLSPDSSGCEPHSTDFGKFELYFTEPADNTCLSGSHPNVNRVHDRSDKPDTDHVVRQSPCSNDVKCSPHNASQSTSPTCTSLVVSIDRLLPRELLLHRIVLPSARHNYFDYFRFFGRRPLYSSLLESQILRGNTNFLSLAHFHVSQDLQAQGVSRSVSEPCLLTSLNDDSCDEQSVVPVHQFRALHRRTVSNVEDYHSDVSSVMSRQGSSRGSPHGSSRTRNILCRLMCHLLTRPEQFHT